MKLILSVKELEIIKQTEYKRGWTDCERESNEFKDWVTELEKQSKFPKGFIPDNDVYQIKCPQCGKANGHGSFEVCFGEPINYTTSTW